MSSLTEYLPQGFDANNVETGDFEPLAPGKYLAMISKAEVKPTRAGNGAGLSLEFTTLDPVNGRKVFNWINISNPNPKATEIGQQELAKLCKAIGLNQPQDTNEFLQKQCVLTVAIDKDDSTRNVIKGVSSATVSPQQAVGVPVNAPQAPQAQPAPTQAAPQAQGDKPAWLQ